MAEARVQISQDWTFGSLRWRTGSDHQRFGWKQRECMMENQWAEWDLAEEQWHSHRRVSGSTRQEQCSGTANLMQDSEALALFRTPGLHHCWLREPPAHVLWVHSVWLDLSGSNHLACGNSVPWPGIDPVKVKGRKPHHWTAREFPLSDFKIVRATVFYLLPKCSWYS